MLTKNRSFFEHSALERIVKSEKMAGAEVPRASGVRSSYDLEEIKNAMSLVADFDLTAVPRGADPQTFKAWFAERWAQVRCCTGPCIALRNRPGYYCQECYMVDPFMGPANVLQYVVMHRTSMTENFLCRACRRPILDERGDPEACEKCASAKNLLKLTCEEKFIN